MFSKTQSQFKLHRAHGDKHIHKVWCPESTPCFRLLPGLYWADGGALQSCSDAVEAQLMLSLGLPTTFFFW